MESTGKTVRRLLEEHGLELNDVRRHLAYQEALRMLTYAERPAELARLVWSGRLEAELYRMEERMIEELQDQLDRRLIDEAEIMKILGEVEAAKTLW